MGLESNEAVKQLRALVDEVDEALQPAFENIHQGYLNESLARFLKARDWNVPKAYKMLVDCLKWRIQNEIDVILAKPISPVDLYRAIRDTQLIGLSGYSKMGIPVFAFGAGLSTFDKASVHYYVQSHIQLNEYRDRVVLPTATKLQGRYIGTCVKVLDMTGLKLSSLSLIKLLTTISTVDDLNYPEKTDTYYVVNAPYVFSTCWKAVKPLLQERTRRKVQVLQGSGREELLKIMDYSALPHFCKREGSGSSRRSNNDAEVCCYSLDHPYHQHMYSYMKQQARLSELPAPIRQGSFHVAVPTTDIDDTKIALILEDPFKKYGENNGIRHSIKDGLMIKGD